MDAKVVPPGSMIPLRPVQDRGWSTGFANLFAREIHGWFGGRNWLVHALIWGAISFGMATMVFFTEGDLGEVGERAMTAMSVYIAMAILAPAVGAVIVMQDAIIDERRSGTAAWILSKPVTRAAFLGSKLLANSIGFLLTAVALPALAFYVEFALVAPGLLVAAGFAAGMGLVALHTLFYMTLTLLLGVVSNNRGAAIGIPLALLFMQQYLIGFLPWLGPLLPYWVMSPVGGSASPAGWPSMLLATGQQLPTSGPVIALAAWLVLFAGVALWRFQKEEL